MTSPQAKKKRFVARPLLVAGAGLGVISMGASQAFASGNLMAHTPCPPGETRRGERCVAAMLPDGGSSAVADGGVEKQHKAK
jgi:hypothetical protein